MLLERRVSCELSNADALDSRTASEVMLIDSDDLEITDQMFLLAQVRKAIAALPNGLQVAVFRVTDGTVIQLRGFSTDKEDLQRAVGEGLPLLTHTIHSKFQSAVDQLITVAAFLQQVPGRKNLLWLTGAFPLVPVTSDEQVAGGTSADFASRARIIHQIQGNAQGSVYMINNSSGSPTSIARIVPSMKLMNGQPSNQQVSAVVSFNL